MARGKAVTLSNGRSWPNLRLAEDHFRGIRDRQALNTPIQDSVAHDDLCALLERYDSAVTSGPSKIGCGVAHFEVRKNFVKGGVTLGFWVVRADRTETDFSFITAVAGKAKGVDTEFVEACRDSIYGIVSEAKRRFLSDFGDEQRRIPCEITGDLVALEDAVFDYAPVSFVDIVWQFRSEMMWMDGIPDGVLSPPADAQIQVSFVDIAVMVDFQQFYRQRAKLRVISKSVARSTVLATRLSAVQRPLCFL
jgi:hypothetical protein